MTNAPPGYQPVAGARRNDVGGKPGPVSHALVAELVTVARRERDLVSWVIAYADPTGETAVRNVMRELSRSS
jgi:hypothetical protein